MNKATSFTVCNSNASAVVGQVTHSGTLDALQETLHRFKKVYRFDHALVTLRDQYGNTVARYLVQQLEL